MYVLILEWGEVLSILSFYVYKKTFFIGEKIRNFFCKKLVNDGKYTHHVYKIYYLVTKGLINFFCTFKLYYII